MRKDKLLATCAVILAGGGAGAITGSMTAAQQPDAPPSGDADAYLSCVQKDPQNGVTTNLNMDAVASGIATMTEREMQETAHALGLPRCNAVYIDATATRIIGVRKLYEPGSRLPLQIRVPAALLTKE